MKLSRREKMGDLKGGETKTAIYPIRLLLDGSGEPIGF